MKTLPLPGRNDARGSVDSVRPSAVGVYSGNVVTNESGDATITVSELVKNSTLDFRYQLTVVGQFAQAIILQKMTGNHFKIKTDKPNVEVSWQVTAIQLE